MFSFPYQIYITQNILNVNLPSCFLLIGLPYGAGTRGLPSVKLKSHRNFVILLQDFGELTTEWPPVKISRPAYAFLQIL